MDPAVNPDELVWSGVAAQARALETGQVRSPELVDAAVRRLRVVDEALNAFRVVLVDCASRDAAAAQERIDAGERGPLLGVPVAVKDDVDVAGTTTDLGLPGGRDATGDAEVVRRLRAAGAVIIGKTHVPQLLAWPVTESPTHGATRNPWDPSRSAGGSSGGSAVAVAAGVVAAALASDGAGSIRIPAAACGLVGVKPTRGLVPPDPRSHSWHGLNHLGPLARDVASAAAMLGVCAGRSFSLADPPALRVGVSRRPPAGVDPRVGAARLRALDRVGAALADAGHRVVRVEPRTPPDTSSLVTARYLRSVAETATGRTGLDAKTAWLAALGARVPDTLLERSRRREAVVAAQVEQVFDTVDVVLQPGAAVPPPKVGALDRVGPLRALIASASRVAFLPLWNLVGFPVVSMPVSAPPEGASVQLIGPPHADEMLLRLAAQLEPVLGWSRWRPPLPR